MRLNQLRKHPNEDWTVLWGRGWTLHLHDRRANPLTGEPPQRVPPETKTSYHLSSSPARKFTSRFYKIILFGAQDSAVGWAQRTWDAWPAERLPFTGKLPHLSRAFARFRRHDEDYYQSISPPGIVWTARAHCKILWCGMHRR